MNNSHSAIIKDLNKDLLEACKMNDLKQVKELVKIGADVQLQSNKDAYKSTPLHLAISNGSLEICEFLIENGADVHIEDQHQYTPLNLASYYNRVEICELLIKSGAEVNSKNSVKESPLEWATLGGSLEACEFLLKNGADITSKNQRGQTAYDVAIEEKEKGEGNTFVMNLLKKHLERAKLKKKVQSQLKDIEI
jgi:uncharacterized protein